MIMIILLLLISHNLVITISSYNVFLHLYNQTLNYIILKGKKEQNFTIKFLLPLHSMSQVKKCAKICLKDSQQ